jgi:hypothetical protein
MGIMDSKCNNCDINTATHYKCIVENLYKCRCKDIIRPKLHRRRSNDYTYTKDLSMFDYFPENCRCQHRKEYSDYITRTLRTNIPILEFKGDAPTDPINTDTVEWIFLACDECMKDRPWVKQYMLIIPEEELPTDEDEYIVD